MSIAACPDCRPFGHRQLMCANPQRHHVRRGVMGPVLFASWWGALLAFLAEIL